MSSTAIRDYVLAVVVAALAALATLPAAGRWEQIGTLMVLVGLVALAGARPVRISSQRVELTTTHPLVLCALAVLGSLPAVVIAMVGVIASALGRGAPPKRLKLVFNFAAVALSTVAAAWTFMALGGVAGARVQELLWPLFGATTVYFLVNTGLVTVAISIEKSKRLFDIWRSTFLSLTVSYSTGLTVSICALLLLQVAGPWGLALAMPPCWLLLSFYRTHRGRLEEQERRIHEVETLNAELKGTVLELRHALAHVKELQGLLPICMHCKSIRDDQDTWHRLEAYLAEHSGAKFTHALCGDCRDEHYPNVARRSK